VDEQALAALELDAVLARLEAATATPYGAERALALTPAADAADVARRQARTSEAVALLDDAAEPALQGIPEIRDVIAHAERGGRLTPRALADVAAVAEGALRVQPHEAAPLLSELAARIDPSLRALAEEIRTGVADDGEGLRDTASPRLRQLRADLRRSRRSVEEALQRLVRSSQLQPHLQETFVTERAGRPVLAVKAGSRASVPGIVHDASASGQTLFVEPFQAVELSNRHAETVAAEREEVERILDELSRLVAGRADALERAVGAVGELDLAIACGALSRGWRGTTVVVGDDVRLRQIRHPLLDPATAVPIDLELDALRVLVVSGPNTGGKTVALKTLGLSVLLHQCGLRVPAVEAELPIFDDVLVEIGDQQSIAMSLSSFAAHVRNLIAILQSATAASLVLIDEPASGTDPVEGAALATALLERLARQARLTVVTTHYPDLKEWASGGDDAANAATALDPETHRPQYRPALGRAGTSHALETAERLGLDAAVVARARDLIDPERRRIATLLAEAEAAERAADEARAAARAEHAAAEAATEAVRAREAALAEEVGRVRASAQAQRERALAQAQEELAAARKELDELRRDIRAAKRAHRDEPARDRRLGRASERAANVERELRRLDEPVPQTAPLAVGDPVEAPGIGVRGTIVEIDGDEAEVAGVGGQRVRIALARLRPSAAREEPAAPVVSIRATAATDASDEVDVRGRSAQEAREAVRALVDAAAVAGMRDVHVIHGRGTGVLKRAVREELRRHPLVHEIESESADGATVARLS